LILGTGNFSKEPSHGFNGWPMTEIDLIKKIIGQFKSRFTFRCWWIITTYVVGGIDKFKKLSFGNFWTECSLTGFHVFVVTDIIGIPFVFGPPILFKELGKPLFQNIFNVDNWKRTLGFNLSKQTSKMSLSTFLNVFHIDIGDVKDLGSFLSNSAP